MYSAILRLLYNLGIVRLWQTRRPNSIIFLMLHGVMDSEEKSIQWQPFRSYLSRRSLNECLGILSKYVEFISVDTAIELLQGKKTYENRQYCVVTFDDGLRNNLTHAMPILRRHGCPATMYVVAGQIERQEPFWFDRLDYALQYGAHISGKVDIFGQEVVLQNDSPATLKKSFLNIKNHAFNSQRSYDEITNEILRVTQDLEQLSGKSLLDIYDEDPWSKVMTWQDVESAASSQDITFGSHTVDHSLLGMVDSNEIRYQLNKSKEILDQHLPYPCVHFCYPNGSVPQGASDYLKESGYHSATTTEVGINMPEDYDLYYLKRVHFPIENDALKAAVSILRTNS